MVKANREWRLELHLPASVSEDASSRKLHTVVSRLVPVKRKETAIERTRGDRLRI